MSQSEPAPSAGRDQRYVLTAGVVERPVAERPTKSPSRPVVVKPSVIAALISPRSPAWSGR